MAIMTTTDRMCIGKITIMDIMTTTYRKSTGKITIMDIMTTIYRMCMSVIMIMVIMITTCRICTKRQTTLNQLRVITGLLDHFCQVFGLLTTMNTDMDSTTEG